LPLQQSPNALQQSPNALSVLSNAQLHSLLVAGFDLAAEVNFD
jgi:hypothetical protein